MNNKKALEFGFEWIFAILIGGLVIFLAIYAATQFIDTWGNQKNSEVGKEIGILLTPFETGLETGKTNFITTREETTIFNDCSIEGEFGLQRISSAVSSGIGKNTGTPGAISTFKNRYLFSDTSLTGKEFYVLSKPFEFPFKVGDLIMVWSENQKYCFIQTPNEIKKDIKELNLKNIYNVSTIRDPLCENATNVCFRESGECDIVVDSDRVTHRGDEDRTVYYAQTENNALLYAAIFSEPRLYDCQLKRLMKRSLNIAELYQKKSQYLEASGCGAPRLGAYFIAYETALDNIIDTDTPDITRAEGATEDLGRENDYLDCKLF